MKVLLITYYFPPADFGATNRLLRILPYLAERGLRYHALTVKSEDVRMDQDDTLSAQVLACEKIIRTHSFEPFRSWDAKRVREISLPPQQSKKSDETFKTRAIKRLKPVAGLARRLSAMPDVTAGWYPFAVHSALELCRKQKFDLIFSTVPGQTAHLVAKTVSSIYKLPWVADFRDSWLDYGRVYNPLEEKIANYMLKSVVARSSALTFTSLAMCELYKEQFPEAEKKMRFIPHGIVDLPGNEPKQEHAGEYWLGYIGTLDTLRDPAPLLKALEWISVERPEIYAKLRIKIVGSLAPQIDAQLSSSPAADRFDRIGFVSRDESVHWMKSCDSLLLLLSDIPRIGYGASASKIYDYLAVQKTIVAIAPAGNISMLIEKTRSGKAFLPQQTEQTGKYLVDLACGNIPLAPNKVAIEDLRAENSAEKLWQIFQDCVKRADIASEKVL